MCRPKLIERKKLQKKNTNKYRSLLRPIFVKSGAILQSNSLSLIKIFFMLVGLFLYSKYCCVTLVVL